MHFDNQTPVPAKLLRTSIDGERMLAAVVARATFRLDGSRAVLADDQSQWTVSEHPEATPYGELEGETVIHREGVDVFVFGRAIAPRGRPTRRLELGIRTPSLSRRTVAFGDRHWYRRRGELVASEPEPFVSLPLTLAHAYGGKSTWDGLEISHPSNPEGRGYYLDEQQAHDGLLPNLEDPAAPITTWRDRPTPVGFGFCPRSNGLRLERGIEVTSEGDWRATRRFYNGAFPQMVAPQLSAGDPIELHGMDPDGALHLHVPDLGLELETSFAGESRVRALRIEQLGIDVASRTIFMTYRFPFKYIVRPCELRNCSLRLTS